MRTLVLIVALFLGASAASSEGNGILERSKCADQLKT
jgi:hypothetical protein